MVDEEQERSGSEQGNEATPGDAGNPAEAEQSASPEEQMAEFEEALKNEDWGHQPC